jgi:diaminopropionate ammonia-lyase
MHHFPERKGPPPRPAITAALGVDGRSRAEALIGLLPGHQPTPLHALPALAGTLGVAAVYVKDEGRRFGLKSFKALGGAYAVMTLVLEEAARRLGRAVAPSELASPQVRAVAETMTFACATDGNHGRSVAWGAQLAGAACEIFIHGGVSQGRADAIAAFGARIIRVDGSYDDSIVLSAKMAAKNGWIVVSDTSWEGYETIPLKVMQGYTVMIGEALDALAEAPTHIFVQAGVGGMAAAVASYAVQRLGSAAPKIVAVEPERAACVFESARAGRAVTIPHGEPTIMAMLECATPSPLGWEVLHHLADGFVTLGEDEAAAAMRRLAHPTKGDPAIVAGESGGTGFAGLLSCLGDSTTRARLGLGAGSRVLVFNSEGATDPEIYRAIVGRTPEEVAA